ncbi:MAG: amino acid--tRNA ligase-related protein, partial [Xanthobacteraceae bacterium]
MPPASPWWAPDVLADRRPFLLARRRILEALRGFFAARGFVEVETPCLQVSPGNEAHLHAFATELVGTDETRSRLHLATSPEFALKKLVAGGERRIFEFARVFRNRERGPLHHPEFTML